MAMTSSEKITPPASPSTPADLQTLIGGGPTRRWWQRSTLWLGVAVLLAAGGGLYYWQSQQRAKAAPVYVTEEVRRGNLTLNVSGTPVTLPLPTTVTERAWSTGVDPAEQPASSAAAAPRAATTAVTRRTVGV